MLLEPASSRLHYLIPIFIGVGHGDIKPDNILIEGNHEGDHEGQICCKVADFGSCAILGQQRLPEGTPLWRAPELSQQQRHRTTAKDIMCSDLYSLALLISQILIPSPDLDDVDLLLLRQSITTMRTLTDLQRKGALIEKLICVARTSDISSKSRAILEMVLSEALVSDPTARTLQWAKVLALVGSKMELR
jgi:serine/threonine protein kinase